MTNQTATIIRLAREANRLEHSRAQTALLEEAVRLADADGNLDLAYDVRGDLITAATFCGEYEAALVAFSWCLGQHDRNPGRFDSHSLYWKYKWIVNKLPQFPNISRQQIFDMLDDFTGRYEQMGSSLRPAFKSRWLSSWKLGNPDDAKSWHSKWELATRDSLTDCAACELDSEIDYLLFVEQNDERAVEMAAPILSGRMQCSEIPHLTFGKLLLPLLRHGRTQEAIRCHAEGYRLIARNPEFLRETAQHLDFLTATHQFGKATALFERHLSWALTTVKALDRLDFTLASIRLARALQSVGTDNVSLRLPRDFPGFAPDGRYDVPVLVDWLQRDAASLATQFDTRNGNAFYSDEVDRALRSPLESFDVGDCVSTDHPSDTDHADTQDAAHDPSVNQVVFELAQDGNEPTIVYVPTVSHDYLQRAWDEIHSTSGATPSDVLHIYSQWEPSNQDGEFLNATFPDVDVTFSFARPEADDGWDQAMEAARTTMIEAAERARLEAEREPVLLPVIRDLDTMAQSMAHVLLTKDHALVLARVGPTPDGYLGIVYVMDERTGGGQGPTNDDWNEAFSNLSEGLAIQAAEIDGLEFILIQRDGGFGAAAVGLPGFFEQATSWTESPVVHVGIPDPNTLFVCGASTPVAAKIRELTLGTTYEGVLSFTPTLIEVSDKGISTIAKR